MSLSRCRCCISIFQALLISRARAWYVSATCIRQAQSCALHLIQTDPGVDDEKLELEVRLWHSICSLERQLCFLTGRPAAVHPGQSNTRFPAPTAAEIAESPYPPVSVPRIYQGRRGSSASGSPSRLQTNAPQSTVLAAYRASVHLDKIFEQVLEDLYSPSIVRSNWAHVQRLASKLNTRLANWRSELPPMLVMDPSQGIKVSLVERMYLALRYFSTSMLINRPLLCNCDRHPMTLPSQSEMPEDIDIEYARRCVEAARGLIRLFPDEPDVIALYKATPWWCTLHYIVQAGAVLLLEIGFHATHMPDEMDVLIQDAGRVLRWLQSLAISSAPAATSWMSFSRLLHRSLQSIGRDTEY